MYCSAATCSGPMSYLTPASSPAYPKIVAASEEKKKVAAIMLFDLGICFSLHV